MSKFIIAPYHFALSDQTLQKMEQLESIPNLKVLYMNEDQAAVEIDPADIPKVKHLLGDDFIVEPEIMHDLFV